MRKKIYFIFVTLILIGVVTTGVFSLNFLKINYLDNMEYNLLTNSKLIAEFFYEQDNLTNIDYDDLAVKFSNKINFRITFIAKDGTVLGDSQISSDALENHKNRPEVLKALSGEIGVYKRYSNSLNQNMLYVAIPFKKFESNLAVIRLSVSLNKITNLNLTFINYIIIAIIAGLLVALVLGYRYVKNVTNPIIQLNTATKKITNGNYGQKVHFKSDDELGELAENFNQMSLKLNDTIEKLQESNTKLRAILTSMTNGVIALDNNKRVILVNPSAEKMFGIKEKDIVGKPILEVIKKSVFDDIVQDVLRNNDKMKYEVEIFEPVHKILNIYSNPIRLYNNPIRILGIVTIIEDITEIRKLERMRKDFVANVSHELKTPLTSIKGFVETLQDGAIENITIRDKFLNIISLEVNRLTSLVEDLMLLSEIEGNKSMINNKIDINKSINEVIEMLEEVANRKEIKLKYNSKEKLPYLIGNNGWFKQMLINVIDNAIKYTPTGGNVIVSDAYKNGNIEIKIKDTGIGIEKKHLSRIFERFYRVDKARSRQIGGTGLGLAIVKHIALIFNGKIEVTSEINKGTEFTLTFPVKLNENI